MIQTESLTESVLEQRFSALPSSLQKALNSATNTKAVATICTDNGVVDKEAQLIAIQLTTLVMMGFISTDELGDEINEELGLERPLVAGMIAKQIDAKILSPFRNDIRKSYNPISAEGGAGMVADISPTPRTPASPSVVQPSLPRTTQPQAPANRLNQQGWSKAPFNDPYVKVSVMRSPATNAAAPVSPATSFPKPSASTVSRTAGSMPKPPAPPVPQIRQTNAPAPVILQQNTQFAAAPKNIDFHITNPSADAQMKFGTKPAPKIVPAVVEFGGSNGVMRETTPQQAPTAKFGAPLSTSPLSKDNTRTIMEVTTPTPSVKAPTPAPPSPPAPPAKPAS